MKLGLSVFWLPYSGPQSKAITNLLTNVLINYRIYILGLGEPKSVTVGWISLVAESHLAYTLLKFDDIRGADHS